MYSYYLFFTSVTSMLRCRSFTKNKFFTYFWVFSSGLKFSLLNPKYLYYYLLISIKHICYCLVANQILKYLHYFSTYYYRFVEYHVYYVYLLIVHCEINALRWRPTYAYVPGNTVSGFLCYCVAHLRASHFFASYVCCSS